MNITKFRYVIGTLSIIFGIIGISIVAIVRGSVVEFQDWGNDSVVSSDYSDHKYVTGNMVDGVVSGVANEVANEVAKEVAKEVANGVVSGVTSSVANEAFAHGNKFEHQWALPSSGLEKLKIESTAGDIHIRFVKGSKNQIKIKGDGPPEILNSIKHIQLDGAFLNLDLDKKKHKNKWESFFGSPIDFEESTFEITVELSDDSHLQKLSASLSLGSLSIRGGKVGELEVENEFGGIDIKDMSADYARVKASAGEIKINDVVAPLDVESEMGVIRLIDTVMPVKASAEIGSIHIEQSKEHSIDVTTEMGEITIEVPSSFAGIFDLQNDLGEVSAPQMKGQTKTIIKARSDMGSITVTEK
ncbi:DUF4097 family beta strand repeat-containing protein [Paenibacillus sp. 481]|uniref:DUF4097 family beta strand repeat-containing protein n=1 Tax=Paenibacillus sp. 481 TaxID=2835869 RepID=UPI001E3F966B|nr:DUF4097 family beta strand repeat-containing protein [Paenibacillus sp. 481]UHA75170.1 DUF4097 family beta strand repeat protein [Paenibacillus sp. 481]